MPGHKRNMHLYSMKEIYDIDITEINGFDNLHHAEGVLLKAMQKAATLYQSEETHFLVNGSTCGILSSISATVKRHGKILIARNCHKAVYNAILLRELQPIYLYPKIQKDYTIFGGIDPEDVEKALEQDAEIEAVFITSPTYDGVVSDVKRIVEIVHKRKIPLIIDEAHGAHFGFHPEFPQNSIVLGADIVIHSVHKTLPAFTQTALIHINGKLIDRKRINQFLEIYQTSSPSYVLMSGIENCIDLVSEKGSSLLQILHNNILMLHSACRDLHYIRVVNQDIVGKDEIYDFDDSKIIISVNGTSMNGKELYDVLLHRYHLQMEMGAPAYVLGISSIMDTEEGFKRLAGALIQIDQEIQDKVILKKTKGSLKSKNSDERTDTIENEIIEKSLFITSGTKINYSISEIENLTLESIPWTLSENRTSGEFVFLYPPGIPILVPGEIISRQIYELILVYKKRGFMVQGPTDYELNKIKVVK